MKKKIFLGGAALLFAAVTVFNMNMLQTNKAGDVSLEAIAVMAQAQSESGGKGTLYGNSAGTRYCCSSGSNNCSAAPCGF